jgi:uncharacterized protein YcaQ
MSVDEARRIALAAQGFASPRPNRADAADLRRVIDQIAVLQLDPINVVCRSHYLPLFARLGPYSREALDEMASGSGPRKLFEYWAHQASLLPVALYPLMRWRMERAAHWDWAAWSATTKISAGWAKAFDPALRLAPWAVIEGMHRIAKEHPALVDDVLAVVSERGPVAAGDASRDGQRQPRPRRGAMWNWGDVKIALEWLFFMGKVTTAERRGFERIYDLTDRVLPYDLLAAPATAPEDAQRDLVRISARAQGVATERQLRDYFHLPASECKARIAELVEAHELAPVCVEGVSQPMYVWSKAASPIEVSARALLSPFDSLIWDRDRTLRLFGFHYRISIYTPAAERVHGYYVMPFLLGDRLVARVDLRAEREQSALVVQAAHTEPDVNASEVAMELAAELSLMAKWLELDSVRVRPNGDLSAVLSAAVNAGR